MRRGVREAAIQMLVGVDRGLGDAEFAAACHALTGLLSTMDVCTAAILMAVELVQYSCLGCVGRCGIRPCCRQLGCRGLLPPRPLYIYQLRVLLFLELCNFGLEFGLALRTVTRMSGALHLV